MAELRLAQATALSLGVRPFRIPLCARCRALLADAKGNPRWDVVGEMTMVCLGGCKRDRPRREAGA